MKRPVPDWLPQLMWFMAGIFATGAVWYFLSNKDYVGTTLSIVGATCMTLAAITLHKINDPSARFREIREHLAEFVSEATSLLDRQGENPLPVQEHNDWVGKVEAFLGNTLDQSYVVRFNNFSGMTFYSNGSDSANFRNTIEGHIRRLNEFIQELRE
jgi:hypothetical protein